MHLHGIGGDKSSSHEKIIENIRKKLDKDIKLNVKAVKYLNTLNSNQEIMLKDMGKIGKMKSRILFLGSFGDAISIYANTKLYLEVMEKVKLGLEYLQTNYPNRPTAVYTQSLGCQIFSCYMWDNRNNYSDKEKNIKAWFSTGNNMRGFFSGVPKEEIRPFPKPSPSFKWFNFWNRGDVLGYPMENINREYDCLLTKDIKVWGLPIISHVNYNKKKKVYKKVAAIINDL